MLEARTPTGSSRDTGPGSGGAGATPDPAIPTDDSRISYDS
jgi:hypothetical protein